MMIIDFFMTILQQIMTIITVMTKTRNCHFQYLPKLTFPIITIPFINFPILLIYTYPLKMKILGIGVDLVQNNRIKNILARTSHDLFLQKILHKQQLDHFQSLKQQNQQIQYVASRWAVKEAITKAIGRRDMVFNEMRVVKDLHGKPFIKFEGEENLQLINEFQVKDCHISLTHEEGYTVAHAIVTQES